MLTNVSPFRGLGRALYTNQVARTSVVVDDRSHASIHLTNPKLLIEQRFPFSIVRRRRRALVASARRFGFTLETNQRFFLRRTALLERALYDYST